MLENEPEE